MKLEMCLTVLGATMHTRRVRMAARFFSGVPHPHLLGVCHPNILLPPAQCNAAGALRTNSASLRAPRADLLPPPSTRTHPTWLLPLPSCLWSSHCSFQHYCSAPILAGASTPPPAPKRVGDPGVAPLAEHAPRGSPRRFAIRYCERAMPSKLLMPDTPPHRGTACDLRSPLRAGRWWMAD